jgi:molecular chaperone DnaJ
MAQLKRDYYDLLGVQRGASEEEIKKAFRALARELHPDVSDDPNAEERFREIAEAYEVLSKPETRELYDRYGHEGLRTGGFQPTDFDFAGLSDLLGAFFGDDLFGGMGRPGRQRRRGGDVVAEVEIALADAARGASREVTFTVAATCGTCGGSGADPGSGLETCDRCAGAGQIRQVSQTLLGQFVTAQVCPRCHGSGKLVKKVCETCHGNGRIAVERRLDVHIPPGIHDGQRIRLTGEGHAGDAGTRPGDAYVAVRVASDPRFVREGDDIVSTLELTMTEAALGATRTVPTLDGDVELELEAGTQPGEIRVLHGRGMPRLRGRGRGDHRVLVTVLVPRRLSDEGRRLLEEFARQADGETYASDEGFFHRLRGLFHH